MKFILIGLFISLSINLFAKEERNVRQIIGAGIGTGFDKVTIQPHDSFGEKLLAGSITFSSFLTAAKSLPKGATGSLIFMNGIKRLGIVGIGITVGDIIYEVDKRYLGEILPTTRFGKYLGRKTFELLHEDKINDSSRDKVKSIAIEDNVETRTTVKGV
tara:strand:+ start:41854 stop:42330 length:477 start_codon:yes stop_codon:yes gene_type:complete